jgi:hypothetical protein
MRRALRPAISLMTSLLAIMTALLAIAAAAGAQPAPVKPPLLPGGDPEFPERDITHEWHWGELLYGKTYATKLTIENGCEGTEDVTITRVNLPYLSLPDRVSVPPGTLDVDAIITTPPPPNIPAQPFPPPHGLWTQVNGLVDIHHAFTAPPKCYENKKVYWVTGHIHYDPDPPPPLLDVPPCEAYWKLHRKPPDALNCEEEMRDLALEQLDILGPLAEDCPEQWSWLPTREEIGAMSENELLAFKERADGQLGFEPRPPPLPAGACANYWNGGAMPALNCQDELRELAIEYRRRIVGRAPAACPGPSWLPTEEEIRAMSEQELIAFKQRADEQLGFDPNPPPPPDLNADPAQAVQVAPAGACGRYWQGGPMPAMNCRDQLRGFALEYQRQLSPLAQADPDRWSWLPSEAQIGAMSEQESIGFKQRADGQRGATPVLSPPSVAEACSTYWRGGAMPALNCRDDLRDLARHYRSRILSPLAEAYPDQWSWLPTEEQIGSMSEQDLIEFRKRAVRQLGT